MGTFLGFGTWKLAACRVSVPAAQLAPRLLEDRHDVVPQHQVVAKVRVRPEQGAVADGTRRLRFHTARERVC